MTSLFPLALPLLGTLAAPSEDGCAAEPTPSQGSVDRPDATPRDSTGTKTPAPAGSAAAPGRCVDETLEEQLLAKRKYRLTRKRLFVKSLRHELTLLGGYYVSDLFDGTFSLGGAYTFFMSENFGAELNVAWSRLRTTTSDALETSSNFDLPLERNDVIRVFGSLLWSPLYGKVRLFAGSIWRYDFYLLAGPGVVVDPVSFGAAGNFGLGLRVFLSQAFALRFEFRDHLYGQELLSRDYVVNDLGFFMGLSLFLPPRN